MDNYDAAHSNATRDLGLASEVFDTTVSQFGAERSCDGFTPTNYRAADPDMMVGTAVSGNLHVTLGSLLSTLRLDNALTLDQVASAVGVTKPSVWAWENGRSKPTREKWDALARVLGVNPQVLTLAAKEEKALKKALNKAASVGLRVDGPDRAEMLSAGREMIARAYGVNPSSVKIVLETWR
jgi:transcriptional regulator with XRE-family HTH domain